MMNQRLSRPIFWGISVIIGIGVTMGVLFPAGRDSFVAKSYALAMRGRNLYYMIVRNNKQRGIDGKWFDPQKCSNSLEFIAGVLSVSGTNEQEWCCMDEGVALWNVAIDVPENCGEFFPVMISANFNPRLLERAIDDDVHLPIGLASGAPLSLLDDKGIIIVRKNGSFEVVRAKYCTRENIFMSSCESISSATYLTPDGKITIHLATEFAMISPQKHQPGNGRATRQSAAQREREERRALHPARRH